MILGRVIIARHVKHINSSTYQLVMLPKNMNLSKNKVILPLDKVPALNNTAALHINKALTLDFSVFPRPSRHNTCTITITFRNQSRQGRVIAYLLC